MTYQELLEAIKLYGVPVTFLGSVLFFARVLDRRVRPRSRRQLARLIYDFPQKSYVSTIEVVSAVLDFIFGCRTVDVGGKKLIVPKFWRSFLASVLTSSVLLYVYIEGFQFGSVRWYNAFYSEGTEELSGFTNHLDHYFYRAYGFYGEFPHFFVQDGCVFGTTSNAIVPLFGILSAILIANPILDFVAITCTRNIVEIMRHRISGSSGRDEPRKLRVLLHLSVIDVVVTTALVLLAFPALSRLLYAVFAIFNTENPSTGEPYFPNDVLDVGTLGHSLDPSHVGNFVTRSQNFYYYFKGIAPEGINGAFIYSTYLTSAWIWFIFIGLVVGTLISKINKASAFWSRHFALSRDMLKCPFQVSVVISFCIAALFYWIAFVFGNVFSSGLSDQCCC